MPTTTESLHAPNSGQDLNLNINVNQGRQPHKYSRKTKAIAGVAGLVVLASAAKGCGVLGGTERSVSQPKVNLFSIQPADLEFEVFDRAIVSDNASETFSTVLDSHQYLGLITRAVERTERKTAFVNTEVDTLIGATSTNVRILPKAVTEPGDKPGTTKIVSGEDVYFPINDIVTVAYINEAQTTSYIDSGAGASIGQAGVSVIGGVWKQGKSNMNTDLSNLMVDARAEAVNAAVRCEAQPAAWAAEKKAIQIGYSIAGEQQYQFAASIPGVHLAPYDPNAVTVHFVSTPNLVGPIDYASLPDASMKQPVMNPPYALPKGIHYSASGQPSCTATPDAYKPDSIYNDAFGGAGSLDINKYGNA